MAPRMIFFPKRPNVFSLLIKHHNRINRLRNARPVFDIDESRFIDGDSMSLAPRDMSGKFSPVLRDNFVLKRTFADHGIL